MNPHSQSSLRRTLILGGARSGKSAYAEQLAQAQAAAGKEVVYIATAQTHRTDSEMAQRIAHHQARRAAHWQTAETPFALGAALTQWCAPHRIVLVDCLTVWLSNLLFSHPTGAALPAYPEVGVIHLPDHFTTERAAFLAALGSAQGDIILVSNEVGLGVVPMGAISRAFVDEAGRLNQAVAAQCEHAVFVAAGLPMTLKAPVGAH